MDRSWFRSSGCLRTLQCHNEDRGMRHALLHCSMEANPHSSTPIEFVQTSRSSPYSIRCLVDKFACIQPGHHLPKSRSDLFDLVLFRFVFQLAKQRFSVFALFHPLLCKST